jgi:CPA2 family monovalent cation:H+ antiporter-2
LGIAADFVLIVVAGLLGGILARLLRLPLLVGYVVAGVFVGPHTAGPTVGELRDIERLAEIGVALLLFSLGLEISIRDMAPVRRIAALGGPVQILATGAVAGLGAVWFLGMRPTEAAWFGAMVSVSSTMVVLKTLSGAGVTHTLASRVMIGLLVVQDLAVIPMLVILPALGAPEGLAWKVTKAVAIAAGFLTAVLLLGTRLLPGLLRQVLAWGSRELFLVGVVAISVGVGYATHAVGLSFALGAFVAGLMLSESEFSHQALSDVVPLRDIFGLLFFVSVGMLFDPGYLLANPGRIVATLLAIVTGKALLIGVLTRAFGYGNLAPWIVGLGLSQIGEFSFVLARAGLGAGMLSKPSYDLALTCTVLTMAFSPVVSNLALPLGRAWRRWHPAPQPAIPMQIPRTELREHVIVAGYGRSGRAAARALKSAGISTVVVESNHAALEDIRGAGFPVIWGDITRYEILHAAGADRARLLLLTVPDRNTVHLAIARAKHLNPALIIIARALREHHVRELQKMGVTAVQPEFEGGVEMVRQALDLCCHDPASSAAITAGLRQDLYRESGA